MMFPSLVLFMALFEARNIPRIEQSRPPVILVPGFLGSELSYKDEYKKNCLSKKSCSSWKILWISLREMIYPSSLTKKVSLVYDSKTGEMVTAPGYSIRPPAFGGITGIDYLSHFHFLTGYYHKIIKMLTQQLQYTPGVNLFGAGYDFRFISVPNHFDEYSKNLTCLVESSFAKAGRRIVLVTHSLGGPLIRRFLLSKSKEWKEKHIDLWYSINGAFAGSVEIIKSTLFGESTTTPLMINWKKFIKTVLRTFPTSYYLFPSEKIFGKDFIVVNMGNEFFNLSRMDKVMNLYGEDLPAVIYMNRTEIWEKELVVGVKTYCFYSGGLKTLKSIGLDANLKRKSKNDLWGDGDGAVNIESLESCQRFFSKEGVKAFWEYNKGISHFKAIKHKITLHRLRTLLQDL